MKVQYFADVNDYRKFALLRLLAKEGALKIGVCWMLTEPDGRTDGNSRRYRERPELWRGFDSKPFDALKTVRSPPALSDLQRIEKEDVIPGAAFFEDPTPDAVTERTKFHHDCMAKLAMAELVFFDPDNGLEIASCPKGRKGSSKFVFCDEISDHYARGQSVVVYQHFPREPRPAILARVSGAIHAVLPCSQIWSFETAHVVFMLAAQPTHAARVEAAARVANQHWLPKFFKVVQRHEQPLGDEPDRAT